MRVALTRRFALTLVAGAAAALAACQDGKAGAGGAKEMGLGPENAPVTVIEYASTTCGHCATWDRDVWPAFKKKYVDTGLVRYELREVLTPPAEIASAGFLIARCAAKNDEQYFEIIHALFRAQEEMQRTGEPRGPLLRVAQSAGMTEQQFQQCITDEDALVALNDRVTRTTREHNVEGTPTFVVNGKTVATGAAPLSTLDAAIQPLLKGGGKTGG